MHEAIPPLAPNTPSWRVQLKHRDNFTFYLHHYVNIYGNKFALFRSNTITLKIKKKKCFKLSRINWHVKGAVLWQKKLRVLFRMKTFCNRVERIGGKVGVCGSRIPAVQLSSPANPSEGCSDLARAYIWNEEPSTINRREPGIHVTGRVSVPPCFRDNRSLSTHTHTHTHKQTY